MENESFLIILRSVKHQNEGLFIFDLLAALMLHLI